MKKPSLPAAALLALGLLCLAGPAVGQELESDPYQEHRAQAVRLYKSERYEEAIEELKAAYAILPEAKILLNLGHASLKVKRPEDALRYYRRYEERVGALSPEEKAELEQYRGRAQLAIDLAKEPLPKGWLQNGQPVPVAIVAAPPPPKPPGPPIYRRWWFWGTVGVVAAGAVAGIVGGVVGSQTPPPANVISPTFK